MFFKGLQIGFGLAFQADHRKDRDAIAQCHTIQVGVIAADGAIFLKRADAAQTRRRCQAGAGGKIDVGDPSFGLQMAQDYPVDIIDRQA